MDIGFVRSIIRQLNRFCVKNRIPTQKLVMVLDQIDIIVIGVAAATSAKQIELFFKMVFDDTPNPNN